MTKSKTPNKFFLALEYAFLWAGVTGVCLWLGSLAAPAVWQTWDNWVFERSQRGEAPGRRGPTARGPAVAPPPLEENALIGRLIIPRLGLSATVREGTRASTLALGAGHIPGTSIPGWHGNFVVAGHRDTLFRPLVGIRLEDLIYFETLNGRYDYRVSRIRIVGPAEVSVLRAGPHPELTLVTCYPFDAVGAAPDRLIVKARQVSAQTPRAATSWAGARAGVRARNGGEGKAFSSRGLSLGN